MRLLLAEDVSHANALIRWGKNGCVRTHPLHFVSDMLFEGTLAKGKELPLIDALIEAAADLDFQRDREDGNKSDTPLIGAASLGAEEVGLRLLGFGSQAGTARAFRGDRTPLGAAFLGENRLTEENRSCLGIEIGRAECWGHRLDCGGPRYRDQRKATPLSQGLPSARA